MEAYYAYSYGSAAWAALQGVPLITAPGVIVALLASEIHEPSEVELYLARSLGFALLALGVLVVLLTGSVPLTSTFSDTGSAGVTSDPSDPKAPYAVPTLMVSFLHQAACAFYANACWTETSQASYMLAMIGSCGLGALGLYCILFGTSNGKIGAKTGADMRTSGWPFKNREADKKRVERKIR